MKKHVIFIHSAGDQESQQGSSGLVKYLRKSLETEFTVLSPIMPYPSNPNYEIWKAYFENEFSALEGEVILIGHSLGGSFLLKYLSEEAFHSSISALFMIAAPFWGKDEDWQNDAYTLTKNFASKLPQIKQIFFYHSRKDEIVPFSHLKYYTEHIPQAKVRVLEGDEHFFHDGCDKIIKDIEKR